MALPKTMYAGQVNSPLTMITGSIGHDDVSITVQDGGVLPPAPNILVIGVGTTSETVLMTEKVENVITVQRGFQGVAKSWPAATVICRNFTEYDHAAFIENINSLELNKADSEYVRQQLETINAQFTGHTHDDRYYTETEVNDKLATKAASTHNHDDRYYTETEVDNKIATRAPSAHTHPASDVTNIPYPVTSVASRTGAIVLTKTDVGLSNVDNAKQMPISGGTFTGVAKAQNNTSYTTGQIRNIFISTADPSGGSNGDIWIKYA